MQDCYYKYSLNFFFYCNNKFQLLEEGLPNFSFIILYKSFIELTHSSFEQIVV